MQLVRTICSSITSYLPYTFSANFRTSHRKTEKVWFGYCLAVFIFASRTSIYVVYVVRIKILLLCYGGCCLEM